MKNYIETAIIPELNDRKAKGYTRSAVCVGWQYDALKVAREVERLTGYTSAVCGGTIYFKLK